jgi:hypothetical protein
MRLIAGVGIGILACTIGLAAVGGDKAEYVGGTTPLQEKATGRFDTAADDTITFIGDSKDDGTLSIDYRKITELEYGQHAGRRVAVAVLVSPLALFSKKRNHYLTLNFTDAAGREQAAVFELGKNVIRTTLEILKVRSGKPILCQDDEARKDYGGCVVMPTSAPQK